MLQSIFIASSGSVLTKTVAIAGSTPKNAAVYPRGVFKNMSVAFVSVKLVSAPVPDISVTKFSSTPDSIPFNLSSINYLLQKLFPKILHIYILRLY